MATDPAPPRDRSRRLWQVPTFLVGLAALVALWHSGDRLRPAVPDQYKRALLALRPAVDRADVDQIQSALRRLPKADPPPDLLAQVRYVVGSAYVALAEANPAGPEAADHWAAARKQLEPAADDDALAPPDQKKLRYRLGRVWANTPGTDPARTIEALTRYLPDGDNPAEGHRLLTELHLAAAPPHEAAARDHLREFLTHAPTRADARTLNQARLRLAELHLKLNEPEEAQKVLDRVGPDAPPEVFAAARLLLARQRQAENDWAGAATLWEQVRDLRAGTDAQRAEALVRLAEAYTRLGRPGDAERAAAGVSKSDGPASRAAAFRMAEAKLKEPAAPAAAIAAALETAFGGGDAAAVRKLVPMADARRVCTDAVTRAREAGDYPNALRVVKAYAAVAEQGHDRVLAAECQAAWAEAAPPDEARAHFRAAAAAWAAAATAETNPVERGDRLRRSAGLHLKGEDRPAALAVLGEWATRLGDDPGDKAGPAWTELGDAYLAAGDRDQARRAFQTAADRPGPARARARVRSANLLIEIDPGRAAALLKDVAEGPPGDDPAAHEEAVYALGEALLMQKQWPLAEARLRAALQTYPASPRAARGRYQFGQVFRQRASVEARKIEAGRAEIEKFTADRLKARDASRYVTEQGRVEDRVAQANRTYKEMLQAAYDEFRTAEELFLAAPDPDPVVVRKTAFWAADCAYWVGVYEDSARRYEKLAAAYRGKPEELEALAGLHRTCTDAAGEPDRRAEWVKRGREAYQKMTEALARLPETEFDGTTEVRKRAYWQQWVIEKAAG